jgi:hypothetical protein
MALGILRRERHLQPAGGEVHDVTNLHSLGRTARRKWVSAPMETTGGVLSIRSFSVP